MSHTSVLHSIKLAYHHKSLYTFLPYSPFTIQILLLLARTGFISHFTHIVGAHKIKVFLKYHLNIPALTSVRFVSKSTRLYSTKLNTMVTTKKFQPPILFHANKPFSPFSTVSIISTHLGLLTHHEAIKANVSGIVLCHLS